MGDHSIPQFYLRGFGSDKQADTLWMYEKGRNTPVNTSIKNAATENGRWPQTTETFLANEIESPANAVLTKIRDQHSITSTEKNILSAYIVVMWKRVDEAINRVKRMAPEVINKERQNITNRIFHLMEVHPNKVENLKTSLKIVDNVSSNFLKDPRLLWVKGITPETPLQVTKWVYDMKWVFLVTSGNNQMFITSDNPVFYFRNIGIGKPDSELTFPISKHIALWATRRVDLKEGYMRVRDPAMREINRRTAQISTRFVFCSENLSWVQSLINKKPSDIILHYLK